MVRGSSLWGRHCLVESLVFSLRRAPPMWPYLLFLGELLTQLDARNSPVGTVPHLWFHMCCFKHFLPKSVISDSWEKKENTGTRNHLTQKEVSGWAYGKMNRQLIFRNWGDNNAGLEKDPELRGKAVNLGKLNHQSSILSVFTPPLHSGLHPECITQEELRAPMPVAQPPETGLSEWVKVAQLCPPPFDPMDYRVHGILQARTLDWDSCSLLQGIFPT